MVLAGHAHVCYFESGWQHYTNHNPAFTSIVDTTGGKVPRTKPTGQQLMGNSLD
jgi:hypothetical protein